MSKFVICGLNALRIYRNLRCGYCSYKVVNNIKVRKPTNEEVEYLRSVNLIDDFNLNVFLTSKSMQRKTPGLKYSYYSGSLRGVLAEPVTFDPLLFPSDCLLVTPAFVIAQLASILAFEQLLLVALEFGGSYVYNNASKEVYHDRQPILSLTALNYVSKIFAEKQLKGCGKLRALTQWFTTGSASPMESRLYVNLALSTRIGGFGIKNLKLNHSIVLSDKATKICKQGKVIVDLYHSTSRVVIEYDSREFHSTADQSQKDKRRRDALEFDNFKCFSMTPQQFNDFDSFYACALAILRMTKGRARIRTKNFKQKAYWLYLSLKRGSVIISNL